MVRGFRAESLADRSTQEALLSSILKGRLGCFAVCNRCKVVPFRLLRVQQQWFAVSGHRRRVSPNRVLQRRGTSLCFKRTSNDNYGTFFMPSRIKRSAY